jgi:chitodextrinase
MGTGGAFAQIGTSDGTGFTATGLTANTAYEFEVIAQNATGNGPASNMVSVKTEIALPDAPTGLTIGTVTPTSVALSWTAPATGGPVSGYVVDDEASGGDFSQSGGTTDTSMTVTGLTPSTAYTFEVFATNATGVGPASSAVTTTTSAAVTKTTLQAQITEAEGLVSQLGTLLSSISTNVGQL